MAEDWDFYFARVDDAVCSIHVDLGVRIEAPIETRPWLVWVWLALRAPRADGLASAEEAPALQKIEDALVATLSAVSGAQFVGRITGSSRRDFYFYATEPGEFESTVAEALKPFEGYEYEAGSSFQPDWEQYLRVLYPSENNLQRMFNRRVLESLAEHGDVHEEPRKVSHFFKLPDEAARDACRDTLAAIEFTIDSEGRSFEEDDSAGWLLTASRVDSVDAHTINGITIELKRLAEQHAGVYDGWDCEATRPAT